MDISQANKRRICIVTPEIIGPAKNGGIGEACYWLAKTLCAEHAVTVLYTSWLDQGKIHAFSGSFAELGIEFIALDSLPAPDWVDMGDPRFLTRSKWIYEFLNREKFEIVHFQDWLANGFIPIQAKKTGLGLSESVLTVSLHGSTAWAREANQTWSERPLEHAKLDYCERYCWENCDYILSSNQYMLDWISRRGAKPSGITKILPNLHGEGVPGASQRPILRDPSHLIFFGRLEARKGLEIFCKAVDRVLSTPPRVEPHISKVTFMGKVATVSNGQPSDAYLAPYIKKWTDAGVQVDLQSDLDSFQASQYLRESGGLAIIPSLIENSPYVVIKCIEENLPFLASDTGGIPELLSGNVLFKPTVDDLAAKIRSRVEIVSNFTSKYSSTFAKQAWLQFAREVETLKPPANDNSEPLVSICISHFNHGKYLPQLLASIAKSDYSNFEVVTADSASTDRFSAEVFSELERKYSNERWQFLRQEYTEPLGATRNFAAKHARGEFIIFMDSDNIAAPDMVSKFVRGMRSSGFDCLTCHQSIFIGEAPPPDGNPTPAGYYFPLGSCLDVGCFQNVFGDANFCVKKSVFTESGGFTSELCNEDWEFLSRIALSGYRLDVVPDFIYYYRVVATSLLRTMNPITNHKRMLTAYLNHASIDVLRQVMFDIAVPMSYQLQSIQQDLNNPAYTISKGFDNALRKFPRFRRLVVWTLRKSWRVLRGLRRRLYILGKLRRFRTALSRA